MAPAYTTINTRTTRQVTHRNLSMDTSMHQNNCYTTRISMAKQRTYAKPCMYNVTGAKLTQINENYNHRTAQICCFLELQLPLKDTNDVNTTVQPKSAAKTLAAETQRFLRRFKATHLNDKLFFVIKLEYRTPW